MFPKSNGTLVGMFIDGYVIGVNVILSNECARDNSLISSTRRKESARERNCVCVCVSGCVCMSFQ